jgi:gamma-glutamylcyclotransferase (GGCT)/AIG2-like uncharacterized protein YtfP
LADRPPAPGADGEWLVVYGSLMRDLAAASATPELDLLDRLGVGSGLRRVGPCRVAGALFDLGPYPALRREPGDGGEVCGELHAILDPTVLEVLEPSGVHGWIYVYNRPLDANRRVESGDWRAHLAKRRPSPHVPGSSHAAQSERDVRAPRSRPRRLPEREGEGED